MEAALLYEYLTRMLRREISRVYMMERSMKPCVCWAALTSAPRGCIQPWDSVTIGDKGREIRMYVSITPKCIITTQPTNNIGPGFEVQNLLQA
jgi:hypothetical protein